eukprot:1189990-Prorocentrum_minimum.AAC.5
MSRVVSLRYARLTRRFGLFSCRIQGHAFCQHPVTIAGAPFPLTVRTCPLTVRTCPLTVHASPLTVNHIPLTVHSFPLIVHASPLFVAQGQCTVKYKIPTRGLIGLRNSILTATRGTGILNTIFAEYGEYAGDMNTRDNGSLIAFETGQSTSYALFR